MLIEFRIQNYRSIAEEQILSLLPMVRQTEYSSNIFHDGSSTALNVIAIYGANASGKSNLVRGLNTFLRMIHYSARGNSVAELQYDPFLLRKGFDSKPTRMEIVFSLDSRRYRYGFEYSSSAIEKEWLLKKDTGRESPVFEREGDVIEPSSPLGKNARLIDTVIEATRPNALFLSMCDAFNIETAKHVMEYLGTILVMDGTNPALAVSGTLNKRLWKNEALRPYLQKFVSKIGLDIKEIAIKDDVEESSNVPLGLGYSIKTRHEYYDENGYPTGESVYFEMKERESSGTQQVFNMSGRLLKTLLSGGVLVIDEIESKLHPIMTLNMIEVFMDPESNRLGAQLVFTTHDTNLLSYADLRRDQINFMEKNQWEGSELFSLSDFVYHGERNGQVVSEKERIDTDKEKRYIEGRYGAIPMLGNFRDFIKSLWDGEERSGKELPSVKK